MLNGSCLIARVTFVNVLVCQDVTVTGCLHSNWEKSSSDRYQIGLSYCRQSAAHNPWVLVTEIVIL